MRVIRPNLLVSEDRLVDEHADQETTLAASEEFENRRKALASALSALNDLERRIFEARRLAEEPITLSELADEFGVSRERVRQISVCAFEKVQRAVRHRFAVRYEKLPMDVSPWERAYGNRTTRKGYRLTTFSSMIAGYLR